MSVRTFAQTAATLFLCLATPTLAQEGEIVGELPPARADLFPTLFEKLRSDAGLQALWASCPADIYRREAAFWTGVIDNPDVEVGECEADPLGCHQECMQARNENACFSLALALQYNLEEPFSRHWEALFARACATGLDGGCTNRGAGIRNGLYEDDPFSSRPDEVRDACLFRTFQLACSEGDAWGCAMHGQSYQYGEGVASDTAKAAQFYRKSCDIDPDFSACEYAQGQLREMAVPPQPE